MLRLKSQELHLVYLSHTHKQNKHNFLTNNQMFKSQIPKTIIILFIHIFIFIWCHLKKKKKKQKAKFSNKTKGIMALTSACTLLSLAESLTQLFMITTSHDQMDMMLKSILSVVRHKSSSCHSLKKKNKLSLTQP